MRKASARGPRRDRPRLPHGYISRGPGGMLAWDDAESVLAGGRFYWVATTDADGGPHLVRVRPTKVVVFDLKAFSASATRFVFPSPP